MLLEIRHLTEYHYAEPVRESVMELWMQPQKAGSQRLITFELDLAPAAQLFSYADAYGNAVYHFDVPQPHERLTVQARSAVETFPHPPLPEALDRGEWDRLRSEFVQGDCFDFLRQQGFAAPTEALRGFMRRHVVEGRTADGQRIEASFARRDLGGVEVRSTLRLAADHAHVFPDA